MYSLKIAVSGQMREIDKEAESLYGIPGVVLMENAGIKIFKHIIDVGGADSKVCFICGTGNNGGDGFAAARQLSFINKNLVIHVVGDEARIKGDASLNYSIVKKMGLCLRHIISGEELENLISDIKNSSIIVDALFGTGMKGEALGLYKDVIDSINRYGKYVISVDIPSGINSDNGKVMGAGVRAHRTVTLVLPKVGLYMYPGADYAGEVMVEDISIPHELAFNQDININLLDRDEIIHMFKGRARNTNKGTYGRAYILGGSRDMMGAALMCIQGALRSGAGLVEAGVPRCISRMVAPLVPEAIVRGLEDEDGVISSASIDDIAEGIKRSSAFAVGPGLSKGESLFDLMKRILENAEAPGVIDADGLNIVSKDTSILKGKRPDLVVTPHPGEMARLIHTDVKTVQDDRIGCARDFAVNYGVVTVLKGAHTIAVSPSGEVFINTTGNPGMAIGGSGDILTGMIVSFMAQGMKTFEAAKAGIYLHGLAGDIMSYRLGEYGMKAGDIIETIPYAIREVSVYR